MSAEWRQVNLKEVTSVLGDGLHGTPEYDPNGDHFFINGNNLSNGKIVFNDTTKRVSAVEAAKHRKNLTSRTILVSINGTLGNVAFYAGEKVVLGKSACYFNVMDSVDKNFIRYVLDSEIFQGYIQNLATGSTIKNVSLKLMRDFQFSLPPFDLQQRISGVLACLDDRITLLRETNVTLEAIAQALFKSWFVDFDPVRAKLEGRAPEGMDEATARLFPDSFEESELGLVPRGWRVGTIRDFARQHKGSINPLQNPEVMYEHFSLPAFDNQQMPVSELGTEIKSNKTSVPPDAVLLSKLNPHIPRIWLPVEVGNHAVCSTEFLVFVPAPSSDASKEFIYCAFTTAKFQELLCQLVTGTSNSHQRVKPDGVSTMSTAIPNNAALTAFGSIVKPIFERVGQNRGKAQTLATLRDTLLPRLISGQLRLPETQAAAEEALA